MHINIEDLQSLAQYLAESGYTNLSVKGDYISGIVTGVDLSDVSYSPHKGKGTDTLATLDEPESHIPDDIISACKEANAEVTILGNGGYSEDSHLHLHIKLSE